MPPKSDAAVHAHHAPRPSTSPKGPSRPVTAPNDHAVADGSGPPVVKLPQEEIDKSVVRLVRPLRKQVDLPPIVKAVVETDAQLQQMIKRLYEDCPKAAKVKQEQFEHRLQESRHLPAPKEVDSSELSTIVNRLFDASLTTSREQLKKLRARYVPPEHGEKLTKEKQTEVVSRLYDKSRAQSADSRAKLYEQYVLQKMPKMAKLTKDDIQQASKRMYEVKKGGAS